MEGVRTTVIPQSQNTKQKQNNNEVNAKQQLSTIMNVLS